MNDSFDEIKLNDYILDINECITEYVINEGYKK